MSADRTTADLETVREALSGLYLSEDSADDALAALARVQSALTDAQTVAEQAKSAYRQERTRAEAMQERAETARHYHESKLQGELETESERVVELQRALQETGRNTDNLARLVELALATPDGYPLGSLWKPEARRVLASYAEQSRARAVLAGGPRQIEDEAKAFTKLLTDDSANEPPDFRTPGDTFGEGGE